MVTTVVVGLIREVLLNRIIYYLVLRARDCIQLDINPVTTPAEMIELQAILDMILISSNEKRLVKRNELDNTCY